MIFITNYTALAPWYDALTTDVPYPQWAKYLQQHFHGLSGNIILDLACGTGSLTFELAKLGYDTIGVDISPEMLSQAMEKNMDFTGNKPIFLCQGMDELDLYGTVDACVSCLDSINYVTDEKVLQEAFRKVSLFLAPNGMFLFDIKTPSTFLAQDNQMSIDEQEDVYCIWRSEVDETGSLMEHCIDIFQKEGKLWHRDTEIHQQRIYSPSVLEEYMREAGFSEIEQFGCLGFDAPKAEDERIFIRGIKK